MMTAAVFDTTTRGNGFPPTDAKIVTAGPDAKNPLLSVDDEVPSCPYHDDLLRNSWEERKKTWRLYEIAAALAWSDPKNPRLQAEKLIKQLDWEIAVTVNDDVPLQLAECTLLRARDVVDGKPPRVCNPYILAPV